jgi:hypothetical protein
MADVMAVTKQTKIAIAFSCFIILGVWVTCGSFYWKAITDAMDAGPHPNREPRIGAQRADVESYCGAPDTRHSFQTARATFVTISYKRSSKPECLSTFTFADDVLDTISH